MATVDMNTVALNAYRKAIQRGDTAKAAVIAATLGIVS